MEGADGLGVAPLGVEVQRVVAGLGLLELGRELAAARPPLRPREHGAHVQRGRRRDPPGARRGVRLAVVELADGIVHEGLALVVEAAVAGEAVADRRRGLLLLGQGGGLLRRALALPELE